MDRFVSTFTNKIDAKGRVSIPAPFRAVLERDGYAWRAALYCYPSLDAAALDAGGERLAKKIDGLLEACRTIRTSATSSLSRSTATSRFSRSTATAASSFLKAFAPTPAFNPRSRLSALATSFRCGSLSRFEERREARPRQGSATPASCSVREQSPRWRTPVEGDGEKGAMHDGRAAAVTFPCCFRR